MKESIFILLYIIGTYTNINLVGTIPVSDLLILLFLPLVIISNKRIKRDLKYDQDINYITKYYILLFIIQLIAEFLSGNIPTNSMKGLAVTITSYLKFIFIWLIIKRNKKNIISFYLFLGIIGIFYLNPQEVDASLETIHESDVVGFIKIHVAPIIGYFLISLSLLYKKYNLVPYFISIGILCIVLGARSSGLIFFLTGVITYIIRYKAILSKKQIKKYSIISMIVCYSLYVLYANTVLSGKIDGGNSNQIQNISNPYNPISLLMYGRPEAPAAIAAIIDSPLYGWGAWAPDPNYKYHTILSIFNGGVLDESKIFTDIIPSHSVILGTGVNNGIFAMIVMTILLLYFIKIGIKTFRPDNPYLYMVVFCVLQLVWNGLFSPVSHFRFTFPLYFASCLLSYKIQKHTIKNVSTDLSPNSDIR